MLGRVEQYITQELFSHAFNRLMREIQHLTGRLSIAMEECAPTSTAAFIKTRRIMSSIQMQHILFMVRALHNKHINQNLILTGGSFVDNSGVTPVGGTYVAGTNSRQIISQSTFSSSKYAANITQSTYTIII